MSSFLTHVSTKISINNINLHLLAEISIKNFPFGVLKMRNFSTHGQGWGEKSPESTSEGAKNINHPMRVPIPPIYFNVFNQIYNLCFILDFFFIFSVMSKKNLSLSLPARTCMYVCVCLSEREIKILNNLSVLSICFVPMKKYLISSFLMYIITYEEVL